MVQWVITVIGSSGCWLLSLAEQEEQEQEEPEEGEGEVWEKRRGRECWSGNGGNDDHCHHQSVRLSVCHIEIMP